MAEPPASRVPPLPESDWTGVHRDLVRRFADEGNVDPLLATLLHVPGIVAAVMPMTRYVTEASTLSPSHRLHLARRTAWLEGSETVGAAIAARGMRAKRGLNSVVPDHREPGDQVGQSLLRLADELVLTTSVSDATWATLAGEHDVRWMMDAVETVAHVSLLCCLARSFGLDSRDPQTRDGPDRPKLPPPGPAPVTARIEPIEGAHIAVLRTFAHHPVMAAARRPRAHFVNRASPLTPHDRETLILRIGWDCRSEYEWAKHVGSVGQARQRGVDPGLVAAGPTAAGVFEHDALLLRTADELHDHSMVSDATWRALLEHHDLAWAMSAVFTASSYRSTSMSLKAYGVQLEPGDECFPHVADTRPARLQP